MVSKEIKTRTVYVLFRTDKLEDGTDLYIDSTSMVLKKRLQGYRSDAQSLMNGGSKLYKRMHDFGIENWEIIPILTFMCDKKLFLNLKKSISV